MASKTHYLKTWHEFFYAVWEGKKSFEVRENDRDFFPGDELVLQEWLPASKKFTGREIYADVKYVLPGRQFGIEPGFVVMQMTNIVREPGK